MTTNGLFPHFFLCFECFWTKTTYWRMFLNLLMIELNQILKLLHEVWVVLTDAFISHDILRQCCVDRCVIHVPVWQASLVTSTFSIFLPGKKWMRNEDCRNRFRLAVFMKECERAKLMHIIFFWCIFLWRWTLNERWGLNEQCLKT